jgi:hypothetical protein
MRGSEERDDKDMWEVVLPGLFVPSQHLAGGTEENLSQDGRFPARNWNPGPVEYGASVGHYPVGRDVRNVGVNGRT